MEKKEAKCVRKNGLGYFERKIFNIRIRKQMNSLRRELKVVLEESW